MRLAFAENLPHQTPGTNSDVFLLSYATLVLDCFVTSGRLWQLLSCHGGQRISDSSFNAHRNHGDWNSSNFISVSESHFEDLCLSAAGDVAELCNVFFHSGGNMSGLFSSFGKRAQHTQNLKYTWLKLKNTPSRSYYIAVNSEASQSKTLVLLTP